LEGLADLEVASVMAAADVLCAPSWSEGFGFAALEAMASGAPVVVSNRGSLPEVVGEAGVIVEPTAEAIADALESVVRDRCLAERLTRAGLDRSQMFTWEATVAGWADVLEEAASR
ncbi:MAG: hypothetical protein DLM65_10655, partial [Candidatus Aeolococcus gillhamiae]